MPLPPPLAVLFFSSLLLPGWARGATTAKARTALVLGNAKYEASVGPLRNTTHDAKAVAQTLRELGFTVIEKHNVTRDQMLRAVLEFRATLAQAEVGVFYFAGHGISVGGANYLVPVKSGYQPEGAEAGALRLLAETKLFNVEQVLADMGAAGARCNLVILDACRTTALARVGRDRAAHAPGGLTEVKPPAGSLIAFATDAGQTARDGEGTNGLYTEELLKHLRTPGLSIEQVFKRTRAGVLERSHGDQIPAEYSRLIGEDIFLAGPLPPKPVTTAAPAAPTPPEPTPPEIPVRKALAVSPPSLQEVNQLARRGLASECLQGLQRVAQSRGAGGYAAEPLETILEEVKEQLQDAAQTPGQIETALATCARILDLLPACLPATHPQFVVLQAKALNRRGDALLRLKRPAEALPNFSMALALTPKDGYVRYNRGRALQELGRSDEARRDFEAVMGEKFPNNTAKKLARQALAELK